MDAPRTLDPHANPHRPVTVFVALGSNVGDRSAHMEHAFRALGSTAGMRLIRQSSIHETAPVGSPGQGPYLNAVAEISTELSPNALLAKLLEIECQRGRDRTREVRFGPRTLDLDILIWSASEPAPVPPALLRIDAPGLTVPHPRMHERPFVLLPLAELDPELARLAAVPPVHFASD
ncbi:MAG: 2-amino-4-hydroxy-6-hydroxymethyldihydropteridine diphosphokinase [Planctomycetota bacterium]